jgi:vancomycin resistance protein YoaR
MRGEVPTRFGAAIFRVKASLLQACRTGMDLRDGIRTHRQVLEARFPFVVASNTTDLWTDDRSSEQWYQTGKVQNLRIAAERLDGRMVPPGEIFSFWKHVGKATKGRGFVEGRMLQQGCLIPAIGGGLCQLSNALYDVALTAGCEIVERHGHSRVIPGSEASIGRDATVAWNYIDLRFRSSEALQLSVRVNADDLTVSLLGKSLLQTKPAILPSEVRVLQQANSCDSCGQTDCFRHRADQERSVTQRKAD